MSQSVYLDPVNQAFANMAAAGPPLQDLTVEQFRTEVEQIQQHTPAPGVTLTECVVDFEDGVTTYVFRPDGTKGNLPVVFFIHGNAWIAGRYDHFCCADRLPLIPRQRQVTCQPLSGHCTPDWFMRSSFQSTHSRLKYATQRGKKSATPS